MYILCIFYVYFMDKISTDNVYHPTNGTERLSIVYYITTHSSFHLPPCLALFHHRRVP
jgi:hypothetical protein